MTSNTNNNHAVCFRADMQRALQYLSLARIAPTSVDRSDMIDLAFAYRERAMHHLAYAQRAA